MASSYQVTCHSLLALRNLFFRGFHNFSSKHETTIFEFVEISSYFLELEHVYIRSKCEEVVGNSHSNQANNVEHQKDLISQT